MRDNPIHPTVDFEQDGVQHGFLKVPYSGDDSGWGAVMVPITVIKNGDGPTALLTGANHGDEYEGPIALWGMTHSLSANDISGRVIIVPAMNYPAFTAGKRTSWIDGGNMNRVFPGDPDGTITQIIADFFSRTLLPMADVVVDIHSGGKTMEFLPFGAAHILDDKSQQARCVSAVEAFNAPYTLMLLEPDAAHLYDTAAENQGKVFVSTELGGGGSASATSVHIARRGISNVLKHAGIQAGDVEREVSVNLDTMNPECFITSEHRGLIEMRHDLGAKINAGDILAVIHDTDRTGTTPVECRSKVDGIFMGRHFPCLIRPGDFLAVIATIVD
ncbi:N(2)-acetyl-L-2,4-diaminobutanoate deacetylase DoeB [Arenicellales bacterium nBUS_48]|nr:N-alpha-acetyl diaminobutyric acid deacetylase DoeB [Pseudomonadota bacterium]